MSIMVMLKIIALIPALYLFFYSAFWLISTVLGLRFKSKTEAKGNGIPEVLIVLPAYKPGPIFTKVLDQVAALQSDNKPTVYCLMQEASKSLTTYAVEKGFWVEEKSFSGPDGNQYHHVLKHIVSQIEGQISQGKINPERILILDKDNLIDPYFLQNIPDSHWDKYQVIQGKREALATDEGTSLFDTISESLNDVMFRATNTRLGLLPEVSGSAALIDTKTFFTAIKNLDPKAPGYDKNFMVQLLLQNAKGSYVPEAFISEEKTNSLDSYQPQRVRWFGEQYYNALFSAGKLMASALKGNLSAFVYLLILSRPPRSIQIFVVPFLGTLEIATFFIWGIWLVGTPIFTISTLLLGVAVVLFLLDQNLFAKSIKKLFHLPALVLSNFYSAGVSIKKENRGTFIHTDHKL